jgi:hypothetical protein
VATVATAAAPVPSSHMLLPLRLVTSRIQITYSKEIAQSMKLSGAVLTNAPAFVGKRTLRANHCT